MKPHHVDNAIIVRRSFIRPPSQEGAFYKFMMKPRFDGIPKFDGMTFTQLNFHLASLCSVAAFLCTDMLELRTLALSSSCFLGTFQYWRPLPLWPQMKWNAFFCSINVVMMGVLLKEMYDAENLPDDMKELYVDGKFDEGGFSKVQFMKLFAKGTKRVHLTGEKITSHGEPVDKLYYITTGKVTASDSNNLMLGHVEPHNFIGELSFLDSLSTANKLSNASATVTASEVVLAWEWSHDDVDVLLQEDRDLANAFTSYCSHDLKRKLLAANKKGDIPVYLKEKYDPSHKYANRLPDEMNQLYVDGKFDEGGFSRVQFMKLLSRGHERVFVEGEKMTSWGEGLDKLYYITSGKATASDSNNRMLGNVDTHHFIGELSFLDRARHKKDGSEGSAAATVTANELVRAWEWRHDDVDVLLREDRDLANAFASYCSLDLRRKLLAANKKGDIPVYLKEKYHADGK